MNLILFNEAEINNEIPFSDNRYQHIKKILKIGKNESFNSGILNGPIGRSNILEFNKEFMVIDFKAKTSPTPLYPITLIIGTPRPPTARRLLKDISSIGIDKIWFTGTELGEKSYLNSKIWKDNKFSEYLIEGAQQGESTLLPEVQKFYSLKQCLKMLEAGSRCALDNNEYNSSIKNYGANKNRTTVAIGPERGWSTLERDLLKENNFDLLSMGSRVLRTETACPMALGFILSNLGKI